MLGTNRQIVFILLVIVLAPLLADAQAYSAQVFYQLAIPAEGFTSYEVNTADAAQAVGYGVGAAYNHALYWSPTNSTAVDLNPAGYLNSEAFGIDATNQVGDGYTDSNENFHALLWSGSAGSVIDLNPTSLLGSGISDAGQSALSAAYGVAGNQEVGEGWGSNNGFKGHALLWTGSAASAIDLNPTGFFTTTAFGTDGTRQVGYGSVVAGGYTHALLWSDTAASAIDLNPSGQGFTFSQAFGIGGGQEVGFGEAGNTYSALLWTGTALSAVRLSAAQFGAYESIAIATDGLQQVGVGVFQTHDEAVVWSGTTASAVDLQSLLPSDQTWSASYAYSIDANGDIYGLANATSSSGTEVYVVEWVPLPEPGRIAIPLLCLAIPYGRKKATG